MTAAQAWAPPTLWGAVPGEAPEGAEDRGDWRAYSRFAVFEAVGKVTREDVWRLRVHWTHPVITPESELWDVSADSTLFRPVRSLRFVQVGAPSQDDWARSMVALLRGTLDKSVAPCVWMRAGFEVQPTHWRWLDWSTMQESEWSRLRSMGLPWATAEQLGAPIFLRWKDHP